MIETSEQIRSKVQLNYERLCKQLLLEEAGRLTDDWNLFISSLFFLFHSLQPRRCGPDESDLETFQTAY